MILKNEIVDKKVFGALGFKLIASITSVTVLLIQGFTHAGHLLHIKNTQANLVLVLLAMVGTFSAAVFAIYYTSESIPHFGLYIIGAFIVAFILEFVLRLLNNRTIEKQFTERIQELEEDVKNNLKEKRDEFRKKNH